jgi:putative transposase
MFVAEQFLSSLVKEYGKHPVSTDGVVHGIQSKYLKLRDHIHSSYEKSIIERTIEYLKYRTECFDDYFTCKKEKCILKHIINWLNLFIDYHNRRCDFLT